MSADAASGGDGDRDALDRLREHRDVLEVIADADVTGSTAAHRLLRALEEVDR